MRRQQSWGISFSIVSFVTGAFANTPAITSPFEAAGNAQVGIQLAVDLPALAISYGLGDVRWDAFPLPDGTTVDLDLRRVEPFSADAQIVLETASGSVHLPLPRIFAFGGQIVGEADSLFVVVVGNSGVNGLFRRGDRQFVLSSGPSMSVGEAVFYESTAQTSELLNIQIPSCGSDLINQGHAVVAGVPSAGGTRGTPCRLATLAIETDNEYLAHFGGSTAAASAYAATLISAVSEIYARDVNARLQIGYLRLWEAADPWTTNDAIQQIFDFQDYWNANMTHIARNAAHYLSPRQMASAGGVAYLPGLCQFEYDYGLSAYLNGFFPYPIQNNHPQNWDLMVVSHELGHNFGAPHTHDMSPPVDGCAFGDCSVVPNGTIMSYCHSCSGGMSNVRMEFHSRTINEAILPYLANDAPCDLTIQNVSITGQPASTNTCPGAGVSFSVSAGGGGTISYQWRRNGTNIVGATSSTYSIVSYIPGVHAGTYDCVVTNVCSSLTSNPATLGTCSGPANDVNGDCAVDLTDLAQLLSRFGTAAGATHADGDLDGDGDVDLSDLALMLASFGSSGC